MRKILFFMLLMFTTESVVGQKEFNNAQLKLRNSIEVFLREEGFMPTIDSDGDIKFKKEGDIYFVIIDERDTSPFYIKMSKFYKYNNSFSKSRIKELLPELNLTKAVKVVLHDDIYAYQAEMYLINAENFKHVFYKLMEQLKALETETAEKCTTTTLGT